MKQFSASNSDDAVQTPIMSLETEEEELKDVKIDATLMITSNDSKMNTWFGFVSEGALFLRGNGWDDMDIRESVVAALDLAEEQLGCQAVYLCLEKSNPNLAKLVRTLMYAGFEMVHPGVLAHADPKYLVLGMDL
ncbi:acyl-CoA N-acyltransferase [Dissophora ornata]|nr:acyl-CoA N-acyltransferase [Dissophora ornata]